MDELGIQHHVSPVFLLIYVLAETSIRNRPLTQSSLESQL